MNPNFWPFFWLALAVFLAVVEALSVQLVSIWLALGALAAILPASLGARVWIQLTVFVVMSAAALILTKPFVRNVLRTRKVTTNADQVIGKIAVITEDIDNDIGTGRAICLGLDWTARSADGSPIPKGSKATVLRIDGVKLIVK